MIMHYKMCVPTVDTKNAYKEDLIGVVYVNEAVSPWRLLSRWKK